MGNYFEYLKAAFMSQVNIVLLSAAIIFGLLLWQPLLLFAGVGVEIAWLALAPLLPQFRQAADRRLEKHRRIDEEGELKKTAEALPPVEKRKYEEMQGLMQRIRTAIAAAGGTERQLLARSEEKLDGALAHYISLLSALVSYRRLLAESDEEGIHARMRALDAEDDMTDDVRALRRKQRDILERRIEKIDSARKNEALLATQAETFGDMMRLLLEQATTMRSASEVTAQIDGLMADADTTQKAMDELSDSFDSFDRELEAAERKKLG